MRKIFYPSATAKNLDYIIIHIYFLQDSNLSANDIFNRNIRELKIKLCIEDIPVETHEWPNMYWMPKMYKISLTLDL